MQAFVDQGEIAGAVTVVGRHDAILEHHRRRFGGSGKASADDEGRPLPHRVDDQADHGHRHHDPRRRGQAVGRRPGREAPARVPRPDAGRKPRQGRRHRDAEEAGPADHASRPADAHLRPARIGRPAWPTSTRSATARWPRGSWRSRSGRSTSSRARSGPIATPASTRSAGSSRSSPARRYEEFLQDRIFDPLGMKDTTFYPTPAQRERVAVDLRQEGRQAGPGRTTRSSNCRPPAARYPVPAGGLYSTGRRPGEAVPDDAQPRHARQHADS